MFRCRIDRLAELKWAKSHLGRSLVRLEYELQQTYQKSKQTELLFEQWQRQWQQRRQQIATRLRLIEYHLQQNRSLKKEKPRQVPHLSVVREPVG